MAQVRAMTNGRWIMEAVPRTALRMREGSSDKSWKIGHGFIVLAYQQETDGPTWWIRRTNFVHMPEESHWCRNIFHLISATALILENAGEEI